jgi:type I restriction-modification system DNA methylase subunit
VQVKAFGDKVAFIWSVADILRGDFKAHEFGQVILPFTVAHASMTAAINECIDLLRERKQALITAAVTGDFDMTAAAGTSVG